MGFLLWLELFLKGTTLLCFRACVQQAERLPVEDYIELLESEIRTLREQLVNRNALEEGKASRNDEFGSVNNDLLDYLRQVPRVISISTRIHRPQKEKRTRLLQNIALHSLRSLEPTNLKELTASAGDDTVTAMDYFVKRLLHQALGSEDSDLRSSEISKFHTTTTECTAPDLSHMLFWLLVVGYSIRKLEINMDLNKIFNSSIPNSPELPP